MPDHNSQSDLPALLIVGDSSVGKQTLFDSIPGTRLSKQYESGAVTLNTKYYTATVSAALHGGSKLPADGEGTCEAVVLVFDCTRQSTFEYVKRWAGSRTARDAEIKLCVANKVDELHEGRHNNPAWLQEAADWCCSELFEYIEASPPPNSQFHHKLSRATKLGMLGASTVQAAAGRPDVDAALELDGEAQGMRRVRAALEAHIWPGLELKPRPATHGGPIATVSVAADGSSEQPGGMLDPRHASRPLSDSHGSRVHAGRSTDQPAVSDPEPTYSREGDMEERDEAELEREMEHFERLMGEVSSARGSLQGLPDVERRQAAEALTLSLLSKFGLDEEYSDSDLSS